MYEIQNGPPPERPFFARKYPFEQLEVGQWFFVPNKKGKSLWGHISNTGKRLGRSFSTKQVYMRKIDLHVDTRERWEACAKDNPNAVSGLCIMRIE